MLGVLVTVAVVRAATTQQEDAAIVAAKNALMHAERALRAGSEGGSVILHDYNTMVSERIRDGSGTIPVRQVTAKDMARAERADATATATAEEHMAEELKGKYFWHPPRGGARVYSQKPGARVSVGRALKEAMDWSRDIRGAMDPVYTRDVLGMKGAKHFTEWLDLARLAVVKGNSETRVSTLALVREVVPRVLKDPAYHAWLSFPMDSWRFRQDSMSYMRAHYLCAKSDLDLTETHPDLMTDWRHRIVSVLPLIWTHLESRGIDQKLNFVKLFRGLELYKDDIDAGHVVSTSQPYLLPTTADIDAFEAAVFETTLLKRRVSIGWYLLSPDRPYDITHEIFALTEDGRRPFPFFSKSRANDGDGTLASRALMQSDDEGERDDGYYNYALDTIETLLRLYVRRDALDIVCEYVVNLGQLGVRVRRDKSSGEPIDERQNKLEYLYKNSIDYIFSRRNTDGSFGETHDVEYIRMRKKNPDYDVRLGGTLHTTYVCLWAISQPVYDDDDFPSWVTYVDDDRQGTIEPPASVVYDELENDSTTCLDNEYGDGVNL